MHDKMTFVLTSCGRKFLLDKVLDSFFKYNKYKFENMFLVEDSVNKKTYNEIKKKNGEKK